jgi:hypothetical protein
MTLVFLKSMARCIFFLCEAVTPATAVKMEQENDFIYLSLRCGERRA